MELFEAFKRVNELTGKFPNLTKEELQELKILSRNLSVDCADILYDWGK